MALVFSLYSVKYHGPSAEAVIRLGIAEELTGYDSKGYHALLDSALMPPLETLALYPFLELINWCSSPFQRNGGLAFYLLLAVIAAGAALYSATLTRNLFDPHVDHLGKPIRFLFYLPGFLIAAVLLIYPGSPLAVSHGSFATGSFFFVAAILTHLTGWLRTGKLRSLALASVLHAAACLWDIRFVAFLPVVAAAVAGRAGRMPQGHSGGKLQAFLLLYLTPMIYLPGLWALFGWLIFANPFHMMRDIPPETQYLLRQLLLITTCCIPVIWGLARYARWAHTLLALLLVPAAVGLVHAAAQPCSTATLALQGHSVESPAQKKEMSCLENYLTKYKGGQVVLTVGRPGYLLQEHFARQGNFVHRLELWDLEAFLRINAKRDVCLVLSDDQAILWKERLGTTAWNNLVLEDKTWSLQANKSDSQDWKVYYCIRPAK
ncbi:TPA: hypothetical protein DDW35_06870 [Candidatus Sumerlaeota bacterium]|nr:hypothetical protein [Candidatus Sumerlaeota bacterium]